MIEGFTKGPSRLNNGAKGMHCHGICLWHEKPKHSLHNLNLQMCLWRTNCRTSGCSTLTLGGMKLNRCDLLKISAALYWQNMIHRVQVMLVNIRWAAFIARSLWGYSPAEVALLYLWSAPGGSERGTDQTEATENASWISRAAGGGRGRLLHR